MAIDVARLLCEERRCHPAGTGPDRTAQTRACGTPIASRGRGPRRSRRGLGLIDSMLALGVMIVLGTMVGHIFSGWVERRISQAEARVLSDWADAGATWLLQNRDQIGRAARPRDITANVRVNPAFGADGRTPHRGRTIRLWIRNAGQGRAQLVAVASGLSRDVPIPTAGDGIHAVGMVRPWKGSTSVIGPALYFDLGPWLRQNRAVAATGDMVAIREVASDTGDPYLHRERVEGRPELNRMQTDLSMNGRSIRDAGRVSADEVVTTRIDGPLTVGGALTVEGAMRVEGSGQGAGSGQGGGNITVPTATITNDLRAGTVTASDVTTGSVNARNARIGNLNVRGGCTGC